MSTPIPPQVSNPKLKRYRNKLLSVNMDKNILWPFWNATLWTNWELPARISAYFTTAQQGVKMWVPNFQQERCKKITRYKSSNKHHTCKKVKTIEENKRFMSISWKESERQNFGTYASGTLDLVTWKNWKQMPHIWDRKHIRSYWINIQDNKE